MPESRVAALLLGLRCRVVTAERSAADWKLPCLEQRGAVQGSGVEAVACCLGQGGVTLTACRAVGDRCSAVLGTGRQ